jgi:hypothetical protein
MGSMMTRRGCCGVLVFVAMVLSAPSSPARAADDANGPGGPVLPLPTLTSFIETDKDVYALGETVRALQRVTNEEDVNITLELMSSPGFDLWVLDDSQVKVWSAHKVFAMVVWTLTLTPGEFVEREYIWDMTDDDGIPVPPGVYEIAGVINRGAPHVSTQISVVPEPSSALLLLCGLVLTLARKRMNRSDPDADAR